LDVLQYWQKSGVGGHKIGAYVAVEPGNHDHVRVGIYLFGGLYIGLALPKTIERQRVWSVPPQGPTGEGAPGSLGGHAVPLIGFDALGLVCITWGAAQRLTWPFLDAYCDEVWAVLSPDWFGGQRTAPSGFDLRALESDLSALSGPAPTPGPVA
jgi:hypothetical protein